MAWWNLLFGGLTGVIDAGKGVYTAVAGDQAAKDQQLSTEEIARLNQFAAEFVARGQRTVWDSFVDGMNRLPRPLMTLGMQGTFVWAAYDPVTFVECMQALAVVPEPLWFMWAGIAAFWFGGRILENAPQKWKIEPRALEIAKEITEARAARRSAAAERANIREEQREERGEARAERADIREERREEREDAERAPSEPAPAAPSTQAEPQEVSPDRPIAEIDDVFAGPVSNASSPIRAMAATLWGEARGEPREGKIAVAWVIRNRVANPGWWGKDITSVCTAPWQFSCWFDKQKERVRWVDERDARFVQCLAVARGVIDGRFPDPTGGADHYYAPAGMPGGREPKWAIGKTPTTRIGGHIFYRLGQVG